MKTAKRFEDFPPYTPIEPLDVLAQQLGIPIDQIVKLDANENPYGPSPLARQALADLCFPHIYPDPESRALRKALSAFTNTPMEILLAGAGADELIDLLLRVLIEPGDVVLNFPPTFSMYAFDARLNAARVIDIPRKADFSLDLPAIEGAVAKYRPKILFLSSPNNPDGSLITGEDFERLIDLPVLVVLDEAYIEFAGNGEQLGLQSRITQVSARENLVVLRTFSKWAGLAGLRLGYGAFPNWLLPVLWKAKQPYNVNVAAANAAIASLADISVLTERVSLLCAERKRLMQKLHGISWLEAFPSHANFILCRVLKGSAKSLKKRLAQEGILVRYYESNRLQDFIRISAGRPQDTDRLIKVLKGFKNQTL